ncbi:serpin family protein [Dermatophilaceae bacterium Sec6.4]
MAGCGTGPGAPGPTHSKGATGPAGATPAVYEGHLQRLHPGSVGPANLAAADQAFGLRLLHDVCATDPMKNTVLSPASATQALGMLQTGALGSTRTALSRLLHQSAYGPAVIAAQHSRTTQLRKIAGLSTSDRLFTQSGITPRQGTLNDLRTAYDVQLLGLDFAGQPKASTDAINHLVSNDTHGLIPQLFDQALDTSTVTVMTNAIYLKAQWQHPLQTPIPGVFTLADGKRVMVPTLKSTDAQAASASAGGWQSVQLPYVHDQLTAYALLPPASAKACAVPNTVTMATLLHPDANKVATVAMPKFHLSQTNELLKVLTSQGLQPNGDYAGFSPGAHVSDVVQKVDISVDEFGTTAAAATGGAMAMSARGSDIHVNLNRPFLFLVTDTATHTPLFLTRVADPRG